MAFLMPDVSTSHLGRALTTSDLNQAQAVVSAIMFKATEGTGFIDSNFAANVASAKTAGLPWGAYHFMNQGSGAAQADHFYVEAHHFGPVFLVMDWEQGDRQTALDFVARLKMLSSTEKLGGYFGSHARANGGAVTGLDFAMVPEYGTAQLKPEYLPNPYPLAAWQYTDGPSNGTNMPSSIPGIGSCDISVVYLPDALGLTGVDMADPRVDAILAGMADYLNGAPPGANATAAETRTYKVLKDAASKPAPVPGPAGLTGPQGPKGDSAVIATGTTLKVS